MESTVVVDVSAPDCKPQLLTKMPQRQRIEKMLLNMVMETDAI
jgi:hypothetical protein